MRRAKVLATLGPASGDQATVEKMIEAGMNAVRINMSHGLREEHTATLARARAAAKAVKRPIAVLVDLSGPKIRTRTLEGGKPVRLIEGDEFTITTRDIVGNAREVGTSFSHLPDSVEPG